MGWVADCFELAVSASNCSRTKDLAPKIRKKLKKAALKFFEPDPGVSAARKIVRIAMEIGFTGPELDAVKEELELALAQAGRARRVGPTKSRAGRNPSNGKKARRKAAALKGASTRPVVL